MEKKQSWFCLENLIFAVMIGFMLPISFSVSFTHSGILRIYPSMLVYIVLGILFLGSLKKKEIRNHKMVLNYLALCMVYVFAFLYRFATGGDFLSSLFAFFWTIMPVSIFLLIITGKLNCLKVSSNLYWSMTITNIVSSVYHLFIIKVLRSNFFENVNNMVFYCIVGIFIYIFYYKNISKEFSIFYIFNMCYSLFVLIMSGSRLGFLCGILLCAYCVVLYIADREMRLSIGLVLVLEIALCAIFLSSNLYYSRSLVARSIKIFSVSENLDKVTEIKGNLENKLEDNEIMTAIEEQVKEGNTDVVMAYNDLGRIQMWENALDEIKKSPLIGTGRIIVFRTADGGQLPHNFILEYWLIYGGVGLILWIVLIVQIIIYAFKKLQIRNFIELLIFLAFSCAYSLAEPTLSNAFGPFVVWCGLGLFINPNCAAASKDALKAEQKNKILFVGFTGNDQIIKKLGDQGINTAAYTLQKKMLRGLEELGYYSDTITAHISPKAGKELWINYSCDNRNEKVKDEYVSFLNVPIINRFMKLIGISRLAVRWAKGRDSGSIFIYALSSVSLIAAIAAKKANKKICLISIVPDLPEFMSNSQKKLYRFLKKIDRHIINRCMKDIDGYILFSESMKERLPIGNKKYTVIEGIMNDISKDQYLKKVEDHVANIEEKVIMLSGSLDQEEGIPRLLQVFEKIEGKEYQLWFTGDGNAVNMIKEYAKKDQRIKYFGYISSYAEFLSLQQKAKVFVLMVPADHPKAAYYFPSKLMEYLYSGGIAACCKLRCIPSDYNNYLEYLPEEDDAMKEKLVELCELKAEGYRKKTEDRYEFLLQKGAKKQMQKAEKLLKVIWQNSDTVKKAEQMK